CRGVRSSTEGTLRISARARRRLRRSIGARARSVAYFFDARVAPDPDVRPGRAEHPSRQSFNVRSALIPGAISNMAEDTSPATASSATLGTTQTSGTKATADADQDVGSRLTNDFDANRTDRPDSPVSVPQGLQTQQTQALTGALNGTDAGDGF